MHKAKCSYMYKFVASFSLSVHGREVTLLYICLDNSSSTIDCTSVQETLKSDVILCDMFKSKIVSCFSFTLIIMLTNRSFFACSLSCSRKMSTRLDTRPSSPLLQETAGISISEPLLVLPRHAAAIKASSSTTQPDQHTLNSAITLGMPTQGVVSSFSISTLSHRMQSDRG